MRNKLSEACQMRFLGVRRTAARFRSVQESDRGDRKMAARGVKNGNWAMAKMSKTGQKHSKPTDGF